MKIWVGVKRYEDMGREKRNLKSPGAPIYLY